MIRIEAVCVQVPGVVVTELTDWIARGWVQPQGEAPEWRFAELDVARVRLVRDLRRDAGIDEGSLGVVLSLLDQVHELRRALASVVGAVETQPEAVRRAILERLAR